MDGLAHPVRSRRRTAFPFSAIVAQEDMKRALLLAAIDPSIGGVLVFGDRGTGKSTAVRALADLLPPMTVPEGCRFNCDPADGPLCADGCTHAGAPVSIPVPIVDLPLGATEDRVAGALDLERALSSGVRAFEPGLLARAHRGFLYIDEVNLLEDHLVDLLLDVAASGENLVERDELSIRHPARFVLVGSANPEEGELRPQLLDRFGLAVDVSTPATLAERVEVVRRRDRFDRDPLGFAGDWEPDAAQLRERLRDARVRLFDVAVPDAVVEAAAALCMALGTDGSRGELALLRAARALAAFDGKTEADLDTLRTVAVTVLRHRLRRNPLDETGSAARVERAIAELLP